MSPCDTKQSNYRLTVVSRPPSCLPHYNSQSPVSSLSSAAARKQKTRSHQRPTSQQQARAGGRDSEQHSFRLKFHLARLDSTRHVRLCRASRARRVERVELCCSTIIARYSQNAWARHVERVDSSRVESSQVEFGPCQTYKVGICVT